MLTALAYLSTSMMPACSRHRSSLPLHTVLTFIALTPTTHPHHTTIQTAPIKTFDGSTFICRCMLAVLPVSYLIKLFYASAFNNSSTL